MVCAEFLYGLLFFDDINGTLEMFAEQYIAFIKDIKHTHLHLCISMI